MTTFTISFPDSPLGTLSEEYIDSFIFSSSIEKLYSSAKVILRDLCRLHFNNVKIGMKANITLRTRPSEDCQEGKEEFTSEMRVYSFKKLPGTQSALTDKMEIVFISSWYFLDNTGANLYSGSTGEILSSLCEKLIAENGGFIRGDFYSSTSDSSRRRYQVNEKIQDFMKRILGNGYIGSFNAQSKLTAAFPLYLYTDHKNRLNLRSLGDFLNGKVSYVFAPDQILTAYMKNTSAGFSGLQTRRLLEYKVLSSNEPITSEKTTYFTTEGFTSAASFQTSSIMSNSENNNPSSSQTSPKTIAYKDWSFTPQDAFALSLKEYCEENLNAFSLMGTLSSFALDAAAPGELVRVILPGKDSAGDTKNISDGGYVVRKVDFIYENDLPKTRVFMFLAKF